jgi:XTP/dITP diphosphohydrolase
MKKLVLASNNAKKMKELNALLAPLGWRAHSRRASWAFRRPKSRTAPSSKTPWPRRAMRRPQRPAGAGRRLRALRRRTRRRPRRAVRHATPANRGRTPATIRKLLCELGRQSDSVQRPLRFVLVFVRHADDPQPIIAEGEWHGEILPAARGDDGFGYDPLFYRPANSTRPRPNSTPPKKPPFASWPGLARLVEAPAVRARANFHLRADARQPKSACPGHSHLLPQARLAPQRRAEPRFRSPPPLSLYVHIPWCVQKCPYCDFNSHALPSGRSRRGGDPRKRLPCDALIADLESRCRWSGDAASTASFSAAARPACSRAGASIELLAACAAACLCCRAPRSPSKPIRARLKPKSSPPFAPPASTACRSASRASTTAPQGARPHPRRSRGAARDHDGRQPFRQFQSRPDVRSARARR